MGRRFGPRRSNRSRSVAPPSVARVPWPRRRSAVSVSRARCASRRAMGRGRTGASSRTTSAKAPLRRSRSAHHGARAGSGGRTTQVVSSPSAAMARGSRVRRASTQAAPEVPHPARSVAKSNCLAAEVRPVPGGPSHSVSWPRGIPPFGRAASMAGMSVGSLLAWVWAPATTVAIRSLSAAIDITE